MDIRKHSKLFQVGLLSLFCVVGSCKYDKLEDLPDTGYPADIQKIVTTNCSVKGCHNTTSKDAAAGLDMSTWQALFNGTKNGAVVIPYRPDFSTMLYFSNTDSTLGAVTLPTMPINLSPIPRSDYLKVKDWISQGAPNAGGVIMFADHPAAHKYYVANQGCDVVSVFDAVHNIVMRMVDVGVHAGANPPDSPHDIKVTPDGAFWLVNFLNADVVQVFSTQNDQLVKTIPIGNGQSGQWNTMEISHDSRMAYVVDFSGGRIAFVDIANGTSTTTSSFPITGSSQPLLHGITINETDDTLYVSCQELSYILKIPVNDISNYQSVNLTGPPFHPGVTLKPHQIEFSPDHSVYFVSCEDTSVNEVRVFNAANDQLISVIPVGKKPEEMEVSDIRNLLFLTCVEDDYFPDMRGSVRVIDCANLTQIAIIKVGWQPHGIAVDDESGIVYVANRNYSGGIAPHHAAACAGKNGYLSAIDMNTLQKIPTFKPEVSVDPYELTVLP